MALATSCRQCNTPFQITDDDLAFLEKIAPVLAGKKYAIPAPTLCPDCRMQRRMAFRQERHLYSRPCDLCQKGIVSMHSPDKPYPVYCPDCWWSDKWNPLDYGREYDFTKPFFTQFQELQQVVPQISLLNFKNDNADYNNFCKSLRHSYMSYSSENGQNVYYCYLATDSNDLVDCSLMEKSEQCYECMDGHQVNNCTFSRIIEESYNCHFSTDLVACTNCVGCHGLRHKENYIFNKPVSKEEFKAFMEQPWTYERIEQVKQQSEEVSKTVPKIPYEHLHSENCVGDHIHRCKNIYECYYISDSENCKYVHFAPTHLLGVQDAFAVGDIEWAYEVVGGGGGVSNVAFINTMVNGLSDSFYCFLCVNNSKNLFGCVGLNKEQYCVLNKKYSKEEYEKLASAIIESMGEMHEWGEFFPAAISLFGYNETVAQEYFPLTKERAVETQRIASLHEGNGDTKHNISTGRPIFHWSDYAPAKPQVEKTVHASKLPPTIDQIPDEILNWAIECEVTGKLYRITKPELEFHRLHTLPLPKKHPDQRHLERMSLRNPRRLWKRNCAKCNKEMLTSFAPERPEIVYCEECYLKEVY